ncbi:MAG TPA: hypothetical protein VHV76_04065 [Mycobacteriales bacterium]|nr:hypothetical protein [Mycobacteriales bacterium]
MHVPAKVTLAMPLEGHVAPAAVASFAELVFSSIDNDLLDRVFFGHHWLYDAVRNSIVESVLSQGSSTHIMWIDPDVVIPPSALPTLLAHDRQVVGGLQPRRLERPSNGAYQLDPFRWLDRPVSELTRVDGFGLGCALVLSDVYRQLSEHYGDNVWHRRVYGRSEDVAFFERCSESGVEAYLDPDIVCTSAAVSEATTTSVIAERREADAAVRVALAMPLFEAVSPLAITSLIGLIQKTVQSGQVQGLFFSNGLYLDVARNTLVREVLDSPVGFTHILWVDSDMTVPPDALDRLLSADRRIVGGLYHTKTSGAAPAVFTLDPVALMDEPFDGLTRVDGFGLGCALVQRSVFEDMAAAYGDERWHEVRNPHGDDLFFFVRCKEMGIPAWLDGALRCGHVADYAVTTSHWERGRAQAQSETR